MNKNNTFEVDGPASFAITQNPVRPDFRLVDGKSDDSLPDPNLSRLSRKEEHSCNRATD